MNVSRASLRALFKPQKQTYWLTRFVFYRGLGFVYFFAFLSAALQVVPLIGQQGLLPLGNYLDAIDSGSLAGNFLQNPTIFLLHHSDPFLSGLAWLGAALSLVVFLGYANALIMFALWFLYLSFVNVGQIFYGFGWEIQTTEIGFLAIFLVPLLDGRPFPRREAPLPFIWLMRWFVFRFYLGAGLIKLRGSECWDDFTCLYYHFETQPIPNPLSPLMHFLPDFVLRAGVMFTEFLQVVATFFVFYPRILRIIAAVIFFVFQSILITTGNYAFFNWITLVPALILFDDRFLVKILPSRLVSAARSAEEEKIPFSTVQNSFFYLVFAILVSMSIPVITNLLSANQVMNTSYNRWNLVNTYGAFGYVGKERYELVVSGTMDDVITPATEWKEYEFIAKPTDVNKGHPVIAPYQPRIDWQIWFAAQSSPQQHGWLIHLVWKFLHNDPGALSLIASNPFPDTPPRYIKIDRYDYNFAGPFSGKTWERTYLGEWIGALGKDNRSLREFIYNNGWEGYGEL